MTYNPTKIPTLANSNGLMSGIVINGLGDSITARCTYQSGNFSLSGVPNWQPSTAYVAQQSVVQNNGLPYICTTSGTSASSTGPTGQGTNITDGTAHWAFRYPQALKIGTSWLTWAEAFSCGCLSFRLSDGYVGLVGSIVKFIVDNGGSNYTAPTLTLTTGTGQGGATATVQTSNGVITGVTVINPGQNANAGDTNFTLNDSTGSGAILTIVGQPSGTFATPGAWTHNAVQYAKDAVNSNVDIFVVHCGTNDISNFTLLGNGTVKSAYSVITTNLRTIWEMLINAGKRVIAIPVMPISSTSNTGQRALRQKVNRFIRAYYRKESWANPLAYNIGLADPTGFWSDGASTTNGVIGGTSAVYPAVTIDGLHPSTRGAMFAGWEIVQSVQRDLGITLLDYPARVYSQLDGCDVTFNPGGNLLEAIPWQPSTAYSVGQTVSNDTGPIKIYYCTGTGTSAASGGPTGTGTSITDGGATWNYAGRPAGMSVFNSGTNGTQAAKTGITYVGNLAGGWTITRVTGGGAGTITQSIESPWSSGQVGQRQVTSFSLGNAGAGDTEERWSIFVAPTCQQLGLTASDFGSTYVYGECEIEVSALSKVQYLYMAVLDATSNWQTMAGNTLNSGFTGTINQVLYSGGEPISWPNNGKILLRTEPLLLPSWFTTSTQVNINWYIGFDCSGALGTATATTKINYMAVKKWGVA